MKQVGIVICNYNKCDFVLQCIQSVLESKWQDFDLYVVDNASTDCSVEQIRARYGDRITLLVNEENLGGSGGFNTGIRRILEDGYEYVMCLDNDVQVDEDAVEALYSFLTEHPEIGMAGAKVYHTQAPEYIQQFGLEIDFEQFSARTLYADTLDTEEIPEVVYCDTVAACAVMAPARVLRKTGILPEDNFLYWDDMEWGYRIKLAGYKVAAYGKARVLHEMSAFNRSNSSFSSYYHWRNSIHFFIRYTPENKLERMSVILLVSLFRTIYENMYQEHHNIARTILFAYQDALTGLRGKAEEGKIIKEEELRTPLERVLQSVASYWITPGTSDWIDRIERIHPKICRVEQEEQAQIKLIPCKDIFQQKEFQSGYCYVDPAENVMRNEEDRDLVQKYSFGLELFLYMNQKQLLHIARKLNHSDKFVDI